MSDTSAGDGLDPTGTGKPCTDGSAAPIPSSLFGGSDGESAISDFVSVVAAATNPEQLQSDEISKHGEKTRSQPCGFGPRAAHFLSLFGSSGSGIYHPLPQSRIGAGHRMIGTGIRRGTKPIDVEISCDGQITTHEFREQCGTTCSALYDTCDRVPSGWWCRTDQFIVPQAGVMIRTPIVHNYTCSQNVSPPVTVTVTVTVKASRYQYLRCRYQYEYEYRSTFWRLVFATGTGKYDDCNAKCAEPISAGE